MNVYRYPYVVLTIEGVAFVGDTSACCRQTAINRARAEVHQREFALSRVDVARLWQTGEDVPQDRLRNYYHVTLGRGQFERLA